MNDHHPGEEHESPEDGETSASRPLTRREALEAERSTEQSRPVAPVARDLSRYSSAAAASMEGSTDGDDPADDAQGEKPVTDEIPLRVPAAPPPGSFGEAPAADDEWHTLVQGREGDPAPSAAPEVGVDALFGDATSAEASSESPFGSSFDEPFDDVAASPAPAKPVRRPASVASRIIGIGGEVLITAGVLVLLFIGWRMWIEGLTLNANQVSEASGLSSQWQAQGTSTAPPSAPGTPSPAPVMAGDPVVMSGDGLGEGSKFAVLYVPRFGADFKRTVAEGIDPKVVLNGGGAGHYPQTGMPGAVGNFAIAAHRDGWGSPFLKINELQVGDPIYVETQDGYYTYQFRGTEYVSPYGIGVLDPVPQVEGVEPSDRLITLTSCNPLYIASERIIAYGVLVGWQPRSAGPPADIASINAAG